MKFARIVDGMVAEVINWNPIGRYPEGWVWVDAPCEVRAGFTFDGTDFSPPDSSSGEDPDPDKDRRTIVTRTEYYGLFTPTEEALIRIAAAETVNAADLQAADEAEKQRLLGVASLAVMLKRTDSLAPSDTIDLANPQTQAGLGLLVAMNLLTQARKEEIELGI
jgi:hypothetical protein